jgi:type I restriction enzyme S subunit
VKDLLGLELSQTQESITAAGLAASAGTLVPAGSIIIATRMALGRAAINTVDVAINQDLKALTCQPNVESRYLLHFLVSQAARLEGMGMGATVKGITLDRLTKLKVPLPPLAEQRRIAAVLDRADAIRRKRRESLRLLDEFLGSAFLEMFGDPLRNPMGWSRRRAGDAISRIEAGTSVNGEDKPQRTGDWAVLKISAVTSGWYLPTECKVVEMPPKQAIVPRVGDLLFSRANTRELVAATCLVDREEPHLFLPDKLWRITPNGEFAASEYLKYLLANARFRPTLTCRATGTSGSMLNVSQEKLLDLPLPLPPLVLQNRFAAIVWKAFEMRRRVQDAGHETAVLFDSLAMRAFAERTVR